MSRESAEELRAVLGEEARLHGAAVDALDQAAAERLGVNRTDLRCLDTLLRLGEASAGQLAGDLGLTSGSVTVMLDRLTRLGYLVREPHPADRRKIIIRPTLRAGELAGEIYGPLATEATEEMSRYTVAELRLIIDFMRRSRQLQERHAARIHSRYRG